MRLSKAELLIKSWKDSPLKFVKECIGVSPTSQQEEGLEALRALVHAKIGVFEGRELSEAERTLASKIGISIMSGHGTGKDSLCAWAILWFLICFPRPIILCTAPTAAQLQGVLWAEVFKWLNRRDAEGKFICLAHDWIEIQNDKIFMKERGNKDWFALARTSSNNASPDEQAETLAGFNGPYKMVIADEASGIHEGVFRPLEGGLGGKCNFVLMPFNPTRNRCFAVDSQDPMKDASRWITLRWSSEDSELVSKEHVQMMAQKYGKSSNSYRVRVLGLPPLADIETLIPWDWITDAIERDIKPMDNDPVCLGVDVGAGGDKSVILVRRGGKVISIIAHESKDTMVLVGWVLNETAKYEDAVVYIDNIGIGKGVYDRLREVGQRVFPIDVRRSARDMGRFFKTRDELWWGLRDKFEKGLISIPNHRDLIDQLTAIKYKETTKIKIEGKDEMRTRGLGSPDEADALCLSFAYDDRIVRREPEDKYERKSKPEPIGSWMSA